MASEVLNALFTAEENISDALDDMRDASLTTEQALSQLDQEFTEAQERGDLLDGSLEDLRREHEATSVAVRNLQSNFQNINRAISEYQRGTISSDEATDQLKREFTDLSSSVSRADGMLNVLERTMKDVTDSGRVTTATGESLQNTISSIGRTSNAADINLDSLANGMVKTSIAANRAEDAVEDFSGSLYGTSASAYSTSAAMKALEESTDNAKDELQKGRNSALSMAGALSVLSSASEGTALEFGSLSVNIGPFNLALRNFLTQVPAILTGMGSILAIVSSLIVAFTTLAAVSGALVLGGALAFFEEFSAQFEETGEAVEALGAALRDLFSAALEPLMTADNINVFTGFINSLAEITNRFAQFAQIMRGDVLGAISQMEGDVDDFFNAMRTSFLLLEPAVITIVNFFLNDFPPILERFASLTRRVSGDLNIMIQAFGRLMNQLLDVASVVLSGLAPAVTIIVTLLTDAFILFNKIPDAISRNAILFGILSLAVTKLTLAVSGLITTITGLTGTMAAQAGTGTFLGFVYTKLTGAAMGYAAGNLSLLSAIQLVTGSLWQQIVAMKTNTITTAQNSLATKVLGTAKASVVASILAAAGAFTTEAGAITAGSIAMGIYSGITAIASAVTWSLNAALGVLAGALGAILSPIGIAIAIIPVLLGLLAQLAGFDVLGGIANFFKGIIGFIKDTIKWMKSLLGLGGSDFMSSEMSVDDIQTKADMNLNFEESVENNVDVQADPEEKAQLSRITKDAIEEAGTQ